MRETCGVLILGHGSKLTFNKDTVEAVAAMLAERMTNVSVKTAYLNVDHPTIEEGLASFAKTGVTTLYVLPLFLAHGTHTLKDIPEVLGLSNGERRTTLSLGDRSVNIVYVEPLGNDPCIADLALKRLQEA
jgi:sirohydrochlorin cobaltochelatase